MQRKVVFVVPPQHNSQDNIKSGESPTGKSGCQCQKTKCLKLYCQCFHDGKECGEECGCQDCKNTHQAEERKVAIIKIIHKYKDNYIQKLMGDTGPGCSCKKSKCKLNYCECFIKGKECGSHCNCKKCGNGRKQPQREILS